MGGYQDWIATHYGSDPVYTGTRVLFIRKGTEFNWKDPNELKGLRLGILRADKPPSQFKEAIEKGYLKIDKGNSEEINFKKLVHKRINMIAINYDVGIETMKNALSKAERNQIVAHPDPLRISIYRVNFNKKNNEKSLKLLKKFNEGLYILRKKGIIEKMLEASRRGEYKM